MRILIAIIMPFLGMLLCGKIFQSLLCLVLQCTVVGWLPCSIWAVLVVNNHYADKRQEHLAKAMGKSRQAAD